jgi:hypothetical protein
MSTLQYPLLLTVTLLSPFWCMAQKTKTISPTEACAIPKITASSGYKLGEIKKQPDKTADLPSVVRTVEQALKCYQVLSQEKDPMQPQGLPKLSSAVMDFKTTTGETVGFTFSIFVFKIGGSREKDVTDDINFTYSVPKPPPAQPAGLVKTAAPQLYEELVKDVQAAARAAQAQSTALGMPLSKVQIVVSYGIKFDGNVSVNAPVQLVTIGGNGDYNKNNTQTVTLNFGQ